jgi:hypothetical protein
VSDDGDFLKRWSRRKLASKESVAAPADEAMSAKPVVQPPAPPGETRPEDKAPLPPVESLTPESDFTAFMKPDVDPGVRREAMKVLMRDPRFNVMDGLDVYIDDYSKPDPLPPEWLAQMNQMKHLGHYVEKLLESVEPKPETPAPELQNAMAEQQVAAVPAEPPADTAANQSPAPE